LGAPVWIWLWLGVHAQPNTARCIWLRAVVHFGRGDCSISVYVESNRRSSGDRHGRWGAYVKMIMEASVCGCCGYRGNCRAAGAVAAGQQVLWLQGSAWVTSEAQRGGMFLQ
jgi:hypothetical protein